MNQVIKHDFSGYATKIGLKCTDGRTIMKDAFQHNDGATVPLVWQHLHDTPTNILGHAVLENRADGVYAYCSLNDSQAAQHAKVAIAHGDLKSLSIFANQLVEKGKDVVHGNIREVSLVIAGANPGAFIENLSFSHGDGDVVTSDTDAIIGAGEPLVMAEIKHAAAKPVEEDDDLTIADVFETLNEQQKTMVYALIGQALAQEDEMKQSAINEEGDNTMKKNIFDGSTTPKSTNTVLAHDAMQIIVQDAERIGSLKKSFLTHAGTYGIDNIEYLFPDHQSVGGNTPSFIRREIEWVADVFGAARKTPFSRIKSIHADITEDEARAKGYIKGTEKTEEVFALLKRLTGPTTVYKKQKLDRDDVVDITDLDVIGWLKYEMRTMMDEELARAILIGDGRSNASPDKIKADCIRPIYSDDDLFSVKVIIPEAKTTSEVIDAILLARKNYKGSGNPVFFSNADTVGDMLLLKDGVNRRLYNTLADLAAALRVSKIVEVPVMENVFRSYDVDTNANLIGIIVDMRDYTVGADKGGAINMFDDFDIDFNQYKYLIETRCSGALTVPHSALVIEKLGPKG